MNCTATTRLTAEECLARLDALRPMPRGERLAEYARLHHGTQWTPGRYTAWESIIEDCLPRSVLTDPWPQPWRIRRWAAPVRRLREERRALREETRALQEDLSRTRTVLARVQRNARKLLGEP